MDAERDGAIPLTELADIARSVQQTVDQIARSLNDRSGTGRPPDFLRKLSALEAVGIEPGSAVLEIEAPHDTESFPIDFGGADAGVQAVELFVRSIRALGRGEAPPSEIGDPATTSLGRFVVAVGRHERVHVESSVAGKVKSGDFVPSLVLPPSRKPVDPPTSDVAVELVGTLYEVDVRRHQYRIEDDQGRTLYLSISKGIDVVAIARTLLGEPVHVWAVTDPGEAGPDHFIATSIASARSREMDEYYSWDFEAALAEVEPINSLSDLAIPGLDGEEFDAFWAAVNE